MTGIGGQLAEQCENFGRAWNRFWYQPSDPSLVAALRILIGLSVLAYLLSHTADLMLWFASDGLLPIDTVRQLTGSAGSDQPLGFRWSYLYFVDAPVLLWTVHLLSLLVVAAMTVGLCTRVSCVASLVVVLSYVHRAPMITGLSEPVLTMMLLYLCIAPCGVCYSWDAWRRRVQGRSAGTVVENSVAATVSVRLMQIHLSAFYLMMGLTKLVGTTWWSGEAVWWLGARIESRLIDWTFLHDYMLLVNLWTHAIILFELSFGVLVWNRWVRFFLLAWAVIMWASLALLTGLINFCVLMLIANLCFVPPQTIRAILKTWSSASARSEVVSKA